jgi:hypothetical protein
VSDYSYFGCKECKGQEGYDAPQGLVWWEDVVVLIENWGIVKATLALNEKIGAHPLEIRLLGASDIIPFLQEHYDAGHTVTLSGIEIQKEWRRDK